MKRRTCRTALIGVSRTTIFHVSPACFGWRALWPWVSSRQAHGFFCNWQQAPWASLGFRGGAEAAIRKGILKENLLDAVIGLPPKLFDGSDAPAVVLVFRKEKSVDDVLFIDKLTVAEPVGMKALIEERKLIKVELDRLDEELEDFFARLA